jgi:DNA-directed RNA polymerase specialized sigma subunit
MARTPEHKFVERSFDPAILDKFGNDETLWYETPDEKCEGLREGRRRKRAVGRVRKAMAERLTEKQQFCINEHFFERKSMRRIAAEQGLHFSTIAQHVKAGIRRLRKALC